MVCPVCVLCVYCVCIVCDVCVVCGATGCMGKRNGRYATNILAPNNNSILMVLGFCLFEIVFWWAILFYYIEANLIIFVYLLHVLQNGARVMADFSEVGDADSIRGFTADSRR